MDMKLLLKIIISPNNKINNTWSDGNNINSDALLNKFSDQDGWAITVALIN